MNNQLETIIGLEIHVQLRTASKLFCSCPNDREGEKPNTHVCPVCLGIVGALPRINGSAILSTIKTGLALSCVIAPVAKWDRKNYFYPDLPKGYQISQFDHPLCGAGALSFLDDSDERKSVRINRIHLEEDAAKLVHNAGQSGVDFNRGGVPLMEIVTEPDLRSTRDAECFLRELRRIVRYLGVSDADMEKGHLRCDASISMRPVGIAELHPRIEIKNLNSFKMVLRALEYERKRQSKLWAEGHPQDRAETVLWDDARGETRFMRGKEGAADYRYTSEPDILEYHADKVMIENMKKELPTLPAARITKYLELNMPRQIAYSIAEEQDHADFVDAITLSAGDDEKLKTLVVKSLLSIYPSINISAASFLEIVDSICAGGVSSLAAKDIWAEVKARRDWKVKFHEAKDSVGSIDLGETINVILRENQAIVAAYKSGKIEVKNMLIGKLIAATKKQVPVSEIVIALDLALEKISRS